MSRTIKPSLKNLYDANVEKAADQLVTLLEAEQQKGLTVVFKKTNGVSGNVEVLVPAGDKSSQAQETNFHGPTHALILASELNKGTDLPWWATGDMVHKIQVRAAEKLGLYNS